MFIVIRHLTKAFGMFKDEETALLYGKTRWDDDNFAVLTLTETLEDLGIDFQEVI